MTRDQHVRLHVPELLDCRSVLYVGANPRRFQLYGLLREARAEIIVMEACRANCEVLAADCKHPVTSVVHGDIRDAGTVPKVWDPRFDAVIWWHGPEHVTAAEAADLIRPGGAFSQMATRLILLGAPWGRYDQGAVGGNEFERHLSTWLPADFEAFGYRTATLGPAPRPGRVTTSGHITAWRLLA